MAFARLGRSPYYSTEYSVTEKSGAIFIYYGIWMPLFWALA